MISNQFYHVLYMLIATVLSPSVQAVRVTYFTGTQICQTPSTSPIIEYSCTCSCCHFEAGSSSCSPIWMGSHSSTEIGNDCFQCSSSFCQSHYPTSCPTSLTEGRIEHICEPVTQYGPFLTDNNVCTFPSSSFPSLSLSNPVNDFTLSSTATCSSTADEASSWSASISINPQITDSPCTNPYVTVQGAGSGCVPIPNTSTSILVECSVPCQSTEHSNENICNQYCVDMWLGEWQLQQNSCNTTDCCCIQHLFIQSVGTQDCSVHVTGGNTVGAGCFSNVIQPQQYYGMSNWMAFLNIEALNNDGMYLQREINNFDGITFMDPVRPTCGFTLLSTSFGFCLSVSVVVHVSSFLIALAFVIVL